jgi:hypothetical protein
VRRIQGRKMGDCFLKSKNKGDELTLLVTDPKKFEIQTHSNEMVSAVIGTAASKFGVQMENSVYIKIVFSDVELSIMDTVEGAGMCDQAMIQLTGVEDAGRAQAMTNARERIRKNTKNPFEYDSSFKVVGLIFCWIVMVVILPLFLYVLLGSDCDADFLEVRSGVSCGFKFTAGVIWVTCMGLCFACICCMMTYDDY